MKFYEEIGSGMYLSAVNTWRAARSIQIDKVSLLK